MGGCRFQAGVCQSGSLPQASRGWKGQATSWQAPAPACVAQHLRPDVIDERLQDVEAKPGRSTGQRGRGGLAQLLLQGEGPWRANHENDINGYAWAPPARPAP
jgi:hypothetical protein